MSSMTDNEQDEKQDVSMEEGSDKSIEDTPLDLSSKLEEIVLIEKSIMLLLREAGLSLSSLKDESLDEETKRANFDLHVSSFMSLLEYISVNLQRQLRQLEQDTSIAPSSMTVRSDYMARQKTAELWNQAKDFVDKLNQ